MAFEDFKCFVQSYGLLNDKLAERDVNLAFNLSMMTRVDEINQRRHMQMLEVEFFEALTRLADVLSLPPYTQHETPNVESWPYEKNV